MADATTQTQISNPARVKSSRTDVFVTIGMECLTALFVYSTPKVGGASFWGSVWNQTISTAGAETVLPAR